MTSQPTEPRRCKPAPDDAPALVAIVGPTAAGKTQLAVALAQKLNGEVVSADSQQVYRGFDVGTSKPTASELLRVPHHLVSIVDPGDEMNAARWARLAQEAIADIRGRGRLPVLAGGTGLYLRALLFGLVPLPPSDPVIRARLRAEWVARGGEAMHERLAQIDPVSAAATPPGNRYRLLRALEIHALTGEAPSELRARYGSLRLRCRILGLGVRPPRKELYARIDRRTAAMFQGGLWDEVKRLIEAGHADSPPMRSLGYRHALLALEGEISRERALELARRDTRHYAKRQLTWFRAESWVEWLPWPTDVERIAERVRHFLSSPRAS